MIIPPEHFHATYKSGLSGFALIAKDDDIFVFFFRPVVMCGCVGLLAITVLFLDRRRQHKRFYPG